LKTGVGRNVVLLGVTSLLTDISSEMLTSILPIYVVLHLSLSPAVFGAVDGLHQGGASLARLLSGFLADRLRRYKAIAVAGYFLSAVCKLGLSASQGVTSFAAWILLDRLGKGIRTSPRDALISLSAREASLGKAFGLHRALDTTGAMLGPVVAFSLLHFLPDDYAAVFVVSFVVALLGVGVLVSFVQDPQATDRTKAAEPIAWRDVRRAFSEKRFRTLVLCAGALGAMTISDGFLYLILQHRLQFSASYLPLLYVATPAVFMVLALPFGQLADRVGRARVLVGGYATLLLVYAAALSPLPTVVAVSATVALLGLYYAATDGVLMALGSSILPAQLRATGLSCIATLNGLGRLLASVAFGLLWSRFEEGTCVIVFVAAMLITLPCVAWGLRPLLREGALTRVEP
jgi:MFS family permease